MNESTKDTKEHSGIEFLYRTTGLFAHVLTLPLFIIFHKMTPDPDWSFHLDRILLMVLAFVVVESSRKGIKG